MASVSGIVWRLFADSVFRTKWFRNFPYSGTRRYLENIGCNSRLLNYSPQELAILSEEIDRELVKSVLFGRPPETLDELITIFRRNQGEYAMKSDYVKALWTAISDDVFRKKCFGNARTTLKAYGFELSEEELGKFRWFDEEKMALFSQKIDAVIPGGGANSPSLALSDDLDDPCRALYYIFHNEVETIRQKGLTLSQNEKTLEPEEFDPGPPPPDYISFLNALQSIRVHGADLNKILEDTGFSIGRILMIFNLIRRQKISFPALKREILFDPVVCEDWFVNISKDCRPSLNEQFHQSPCDPRAVIGRVAHVHKHNWLRDNSVLVLGDDDGLSIAMAKYTEAKVTVIDIDPKVLQFLEILANRAGVEVECVEHDLRDPLPLEMVGAFWLVSADPPQSLSGEKFFLDRAVEALGDEVGSRIYTSITPMWMGTENYHGVLSHMMRYGFSPREILKSQMVFHVRHPFDQENEDASDAEALLEQSMLNTINMACDVHVLQRMSYI